MASNKTFPCVKIGYNILIESVHVHMHRHSAQQS